MTLVSTTAGPTTANAAATTNVATAATDASSSSP